MNPMLLLVAVILTTFAVGMPRVCAQADAKESKAAWKVVQSELTDSGTVARFVLEPVEPRRQADRGPDDPRQDRRMVVRLSQASPLLWIAREQPRSNEPGKISLDLSSTNELNALSPLLTAYQQVIQTASRQKGWEAEARLEKFEFTGELPEKINSGPETLQAEAALDAAFLRLQDTGQAYVGSLGKPVRFDHRQDGPSAPAIVFDRGNNQPWLSLPEPGALLFTLQNLTELQKSQAALVSQQQARTAEQSTRRRADATDAQARTKQVETDARNGEERLAGQRRADDDLLTLSWELADKLYGTNSPASDQSKPRQSSSKARFDVFVKQMDSDERNGIDPSRRVYQSHLSKSLPPRTAPPVSGIAPLNSPATVLSSLVRGAEADERDHSAKIARLAGEDEAKSILADYPNRRITALRQLLDSSPALTASDRGLARAVTLLDEARFLPERVHETLQAERRSVLAFVATEKGLQLCRQIEGLHQKIRPHLEAQKAVSDYSVDQLNRAREGAELGLDTREAIKWSALLLVAGQRDSEELQKMKAQMRGLLAGFQTATGVSYDDGRGWILNKLK